jgi:hypothetical protein
VSPTADTSLRAPLLLRPRDWQVGTEFRQAYPFRLVPVEDSLHKLWGERREPQNAADIRAVDPVGGSQVFKAGVLVQGLLRETIPVISYRSYAVTILFGVGDDELA